MVTRCRGNIIEETRIRTQLDASETELKNTEKRKTGFKVKQESSKTNPKNNTPGLEERREGVVVAVFNGVDCNYKLGCF